MTLAIHGGTPVRQTPYPDWPQFGVEEENALLRSLHQGQWWRMQGRENLDFEQAFAQLHGGHSAFAVSNGTVALEIALQAAGIGPGDEVIVPAFTFISTSMACQRIGATAIAVDVLADTLCIDPAAVLANIGPRTRAIIAVHMAGHLCDMHSLARIADQHRLVIIQDAAHAHGARGLGDTGIGEYGSLACFSFQNFKLMTAGEGGLVLCPNEELREKVFLYGNVGRPLGDRSYQHTVVGTNARLSEFSAAVLSAQLGRLEQQTRVRQHNAHLLGETLVRQGLVTPQVRTADAHTHPYYMFLFTLDDLPGQPQLDRNQVVDCLVAEGIPAFRAYQALYRIPSYWQAPAPTRQNLEQCIAACPVSERMAQRGIWIHHRALLGTEQDTLDIAAAIAKVHQHLVGAQ
ncbi:3-amino-5-hydroxybenzoic acid synthase [Pseudomonas sp. TKO26]|uniref:DegT/DnrJ/EryC1/StrS family aminotransferase n=1 Tax=unclassified Pseudomonas TaxID=196821 RepID=UPI000D94259B|nr:MULTISPECIES: DegT/DnrJ/EryC1/StrS family aminotransferase [unclassified Pseudomonas]PYY78148.1 3-amino-5-hydroxybenzoic acid synthase [Pseudomonas sp. TKO30]PYY78648.1 3-amino-5-hydroxybenzoic acid synthase [Pseudomonas sp. TKO29]PYY80557.1 3-amino-5-hydroxybenzoic acid synthase [Pseudomonas sp. TKO26]PYY95431.1 3-amino-5-hydroxybenzoic acid synthase [Pseudomonas sp. TKO14]